MAKLFLALVVLALLVGGGIYYFRGVGESFDPDEQGRRAKAAVSVGMTWSQVVEAAGPPGRYCFRSEVKRGGETVVMEAAPVKFERGPFAAALAEGIPPHGFRFMYMFSAQAAFSVHFDGQGRVEQVVDDKTVADLLDTRKP